MKVILENIDSEFFPYSQNQGLGHPCPGTGWSNRAQIIFLALLRVMPSQTTWELIDIYLKLSPNPFNTLYYIVEDIATKNKFILLLPHI